MLFVALAGITSVRAGAPAVIITHYSDAQCPCSARVPQDMKETFLDNNDFEGMVDFQQFFVGDLVKNVSKCIHGEEECVAQRFFSCAQNMSSTSPPSLPGPAPYSVARQWLDFEACSYGPCTDCAAIMGPHCPCANYTNFPEYVKNTVMQDCARKVGLNWDILFACGTGPAGQMLMEKSSTVSNQRHITYGVDGLAPIAVDGTVVTTKNPIPVVCGPVPREVSAAVCTALAVKGLAPKACKNSGD